MKRSFLAKDVSKQIEINMVTRVFNLAFFMNFIELIL